MTTRTPIHKLGREEQQREHYRKQKRLDYIENMIIKSCNVLFYLVIIVAFLSVISVFAWVFKCPYVSDKGIDLIINGWQYVIVFLIGILSKKLGIYIPKR